MKHFTNCRFLFILLLGVWNEITGRSRIAKLEAIIEAEQSRFSILNSYVNAIASAINGTKTVIPIELGIEADRALQMLITSAKEQNSQLLAARIQVSKLEDQLLKTKNLDGDS